MLNPWIEALGYLASLIILVSLTMKSIVKLRWINAAGSLLFVAFAYMTRSFPTVFMNVAIVAIDVWFVLRLSHGRSEYRMVPAERDSGLLLFFHETNKGELDSLFGPTAFNDAARFSWYLCDNEVAGLFAWRETAPGECRIYIDFVTARYRDTRIGRYFFDSNLSSFREQGYRTLVYRDVGSRHWDYLRKIGFREDDPGCFVKEIV